MITIQENVPLAPFTTLEIGGPARLFATAQSVPELREALSFATDRRLPFAVLGGGSNLLVADAGFDGLVVRLDLQGIKVTGNRVLAEAGVELNGLVQSTAKWGLSGMESLAGIPGLVGGAVRGNAGAYGSAIGEVVEMVSVLDAGTLELLSLDREECAFAYRGSRFKREPRLVVVAAQLALSPGDPEEIGRKIETTIAKRAAKGLQCERSVGSYFMNPVISDPELIRKFESDQHVHCRESRIPAGWLIDKAGLRNLRVGGAMVSALHANYLINTGVASAEEISQLAQLVKKEVAASMGVTLQEEVSRLGFTATKNDPAP